MCTHREGLSATTRSGAAEQATPQTPAQQMAQLRMQNAQDLIAGLNGTASARYAQFLHPDNSDRIVVTIDRGNGGWSPQYRVQVTNNTTGQTLITTTRRTVDGARAAVYRATGITPPTRRRGGSNG